MSKKLVHNYTFDPATSTIVISYIYSRERFLLITNTTDNITIYQFNDSSLGFSSITHDYDAETTTLVLAYDCSTMSSTDELQIFVEVDSQKFEPSDTFVDPVSKFRVSQPENLIDTDFEYGLQSTKWETLETVKNIPTFFTRFGDDYFPVTEMVTTANSDVVTITTETDHNMIAGVPVIVKGTKTITTDGTFIVTSVANSTVFSYRAKQLATQSESIFDSVSTQVYAGQRYQGTEFSLDGISTITTSGGETSNLTVKTLYPTNFLTNTSFYLTNSVGVKNLVVNSAAVLANSYLPGLGESSPTSNTAVTPNTYSSWSGTFNPYSLTSYFGEVLFSLDGCSLSNNALVFPQAHGITDNLYWMVVLGEGNSITGLTENRAYYVRSVNSTAIYFSPLPNDATRYTISNLVWGKRFRSRLVRAHRIINLNTTTDVLTIEGNIPVSPAYKFWPFQGLNNNWGNIGQNSGIKNNEYNNGSWWFGTGTTGPSGSNTNFTLSSSYFGSAVNFTVGSPSTVGAFGIFVPNTVLGVATGNIFDRNTIYFANTPTFNNGSTLRAIFTGTGAPPSGLANNTDYILSSIGGNNAYRVLTSLGSEIYIANAGSNALSVSFTNKSVIGYGDSLYIPDHGLAEGTPVLYLTETGTAIGGLTNNTLYYAGDVSKDYFKLSSNTTFWTAAARSDTSVGINTTFDFVQLSSTHNIANGTPVYYTTSGIPIGGLDSGRWYWARAYSTNALQFFYDKDSSLNGNTANQVQLTGTAYSGTHYFRPANYVDITSAGTGNNLIKVTASSGGADGVYKLVSSANSTTFTLLSNYSIPNRELNVTANTSTVVNNAVNVLNHGFTNYTPVTYISNGAGSEIQGLVNNNTYYISRLSQNWVRFANSVENVTTGDTLTIDVPVTVAGGQHYLITSSISGEVIGPGTVNVVSSCTLVTGVGTKFASSFAPGDTLSIYDNSSAQGNVFSERIKNINSDEQIELIAAANISGNSLNYAVGTGLFVRADGQAIHRPYDGGVELTPSLNPDGNMIRQTRKYFRYQSGKGIQVSFAVNFKPTTTVDSAFYQIEDVSGTNTAVATITTRYPHRLSANLNIILSGAANTIVANGSSVDFWNGNTTVHSVVDDYTFKYLLDEAPTTASPNGLLEYYVNSWEFSETRCGLFDDQNGLYFEFNGQQLYCCRKSSTTQLSGTVSMTYKSSQVVGTGTRFTSQLAVGDYIVVKGQSYLVSQIDSDTILYILPSYRGVTSSGCIVTRTEVVKIPQSEWNIDKCDGTGPSGFYLNLARIQMAYMDYSWYGAGKVRFGFKNQNGTVIYVHEFIHNNKQKEAYMRSGNLPARYQIENIGQPTHVPALAHWGTSVIMDGRFDDDKAYVFNAAGPTLTITGGSTLVANATTTTGQWFVLSGGQYRTAGYALTLANTAANTSFLALPAGVAVSNNGGLRSGTLTANPTDTRISPYLPYLSSVTARYGSSANVLSNGIYNLILINSQPTTNNINSNTVFTLSSSGLSVVYEQPLISIRLAPSVDNGAAAALGAREIINRMQLVLSSVGILTSHSVEVNLRLNGKLTNYSWSRVSNPSLSQLIYHNANDRITGGSKVYSFRAQGGSGSPRTSVLTTADLGDIATLGNSIMGGDNAFPDGPDILTVTAILVENSSTVNTASPFSITGRIGWTESQA